MGQVEKAAGEGVVVKRWQDAINHGGKGCRLEQRSDFAEQHGRSIAVLGEIKRNSLKMTVVNRVRKREKERGQ